MALENARETVENNVEGIALVTHASTGPEPAFFLPLSIGHTTTWCQCSGIPGGCGTSTRTAFPAGALRRAFPQHSIASSNPKNKISSYRYGYDVEHVSRREDGPKLMSKSPHVRHL